MFYIFRPVISDRVAKYVEHERILLLTVLALAENSMVFSPKNPGFSANAAGLVGRRKCISHESGHC